MPRRTQRGPPPPPGSLPPPLRRATPGGGRTPKGQCRLPTPAPSAPREHGQRSPATRLQDEQLGEGERLTLDAPRHVARYPSPGQPPATPAALDTPQGTHAKGPVPGPHTCTPAPTAIGQRAPTACSKDGQQRENERQTTDPPHNGARQPPPPPGIPSRHPHSAPHQLVRGRAAGGGRAPIPRGPEKDAERPPHARTTRAREHGQGPPAPRKPLTHRTGGRQR